MVQHMTEEGDMEHDGVVWDAAPLKQRAGTHPPSDRPTDDVVDSSINYEVRFFQTMYYIIIAVPVCSGKGAAKDGWNHGV